METIRKTTTNSELLKENFDLRRRIESTEDALRRELRKSMKPRQYECHKCGAVNEVKD